MHNKLFNEILVWKYSCSFIQGTYQDYISADEEVKQLLIDINKLVEENSEETKVILHPSNLPNMFTEREFKS